MNATHDYIDRDRFARLVHAIRPGGKLLRAWPLEGGVSAQVTAIEIALPSGDNERLVIRRHGALDKGHNPDIASDEFRLLRVLHDAGLAVPTPVFVDQGSEFFDSPCLIVTFVEGSTEITPSGTPGAMQHMADYLACLHALDLSCCDFSFLPRRDDPVGGIRRHLALLPQNPRTDRLHHALSVQPPVVEVNAPALLHGDFWPGNIMWRDGTLAAVLDWEDAAIGDPLADLAGARLELFVGMGHHVMDAFTARYLSRTEIDVASLPFWELYAASGMAAHMAKWGLDPDVEAVMRQQAEAFIDHVLDKITAQQDTTHR